MKRIILAATLPCMFIGCAPKSTVVATGPDGSKVTMSQGAGNDVTIQGSDAQGNKFTETANSSGLTMKNDKGESVQYSQGAVKESDLQLPFYPDSVEAQGSMLSDTASGKLAMSTRTTKDDPDKVQQFYADKIDNPQKTNVSGDSKMATVSGKLKDGSDVSVMANRKGTADTTIMVSVTSHKTPPAPK